MREVVVMEEEVMVVTVMEEVVEGGLREVKQRWRGWWRRRSTGW